MTSAPTPATRWIAVAALLASAPAFAPRPADGTTQVPWTFRADFAHGLTGWMSFPLAQDIGFDPSLFTAEEGGRTVLVREIESLGRRRFQAGVIRPLRFVAGSRTRIDVEYSLTTADDVDALDLVLAAGSGRRYTVALPRHPGSRAVQITANMFGLPAGGEPIEAVALIAHVNAPRPAAVERLTVAQFAVQAERSPELQVIAPSLVRSEVGEQAVAGEIIRASAPLPLTLHESPAVVELTDGTGTRVVRTVVTAATAETGVPVGSDAAPGLWTATVTSGAAATSFRVLVLGPAPAHPRILLSEARLAVLRSGPQYVGLREGIHRQAQKFAAAITYNEAAGANIAHLPVGTGLHPAFVGELKSYFAVLEAYANAISYNALDYALNGDAAALASARRALQASARWETWTPPRFTSHGVHTYYEVGVFAQRVALGYDLIAPRLGTDERLAIARAFRRQVIEPTVQEYFLYNRMPVAASNWMANSLGGAIAAAVATEGDIPDWDAHEGVALGALTAAYEQVLDGLFPGDGSEVEPAGYENFAMQGLSWGMAALDGLGIRVRGTDRAWAGFWWPYYATVSPGLVLDTGDFDGRLDKLSGFAWGAEHAGIPALRAFYDRSTTALDLSPAAGVAHTGRELEQSAGPLDLACCSTPPVTPPIPPPSRVFAARGSAVLRSGWDAAATVISLRAGPWFNHEHHDQGSFQVAAQGERLVAEAGYTGYYDDPNYPVYFTQAAGHNTVLVDRDPLSQGTVGGRFWPALGPHPRITADLLGDDFDYIAADLSSAYAGTLSAYTREWVFVKPGLLVVRDRLSAPASHVYTWLLHAPDGARVSTEGSRAVIQTPRARASVAAGGSAAVWASRATPISITRFDDLERGVVHTPRELYLESPSQAAAEFLVGLAIGPAAARPIDPQTIASPSAQGVSLPSEIPAAVVFRTDAGPLAAQEFSTDGSVLAVRGAGERADGLVIGARLVTHGTAGIFRSTVPVNVAWHRTAERLEMHLAVPDTTGIAWAAAKAPASVLLDGVAAPFTLRDGMAALARVPTGNHRVVIVY